jgi:bacterial/archaeal transporter family protein
MNTQYLIAITIFGWGVGSLFYKVANDNIHPIMVSAVVTCVYILVTPVTFLVYKFPKDLNHTGVLFSVLAGLSMAVGSLAYFYALKRGGAGEVTTVTALYPALTLGLSMFFLSEELTWRKGIGILLAIASFIILGFK